VWNSSEALGYPFGPLYQLLMLTGARKSEVAGLRRREIDLKKKLWTVPPERFKSNASHLVPLSDRAVAIIEALPPFHQRRPSIHDHLWREARSGFQQV
jgi:integrase